MYLPRFGLVVFMAVLVAGAIWKLNHTPLHTKNVTLETVGTPNPDSPLSVSQLAAIRVLFAFVALTTAVSALTDFEGMVITTAYMEGSALKKPVKFHMRGLHKLSTFTMHCWFVITLYFLGVSLCSLAVATGQTQKLEDALGKSTSHYFSVVLWLFFEISSTFAWLVTTVVTFVLVPFSISKGDDGAVFQRWRGQVMHNANVVFMSTELLCSQFTMDWNHFPVGVLFASYYALLAWVWLATMGVVWYPFLDPTLPVWKSIPIYLTVLVVCLFFFMFAAAIAHGTEDYPFSIRAGFVYTVCLAISRTTLFGTFPKPIKKNK
eukprot:m.51855 g.51855  ORF g.51855 m.51855 type:complete len:320 (-) comp10758_c0_seq1:58-1017(-)